MANLQTSGAISIDNIRDLFGGPASPSLANYYRGGSYIPASKTVNTTVRQPSSGEYYSNNTYSWYYLKSSEFYIWWAGTLVHYTTSTPSSNPSSYKVGSYTYYRGSVKQGSTLYAVYRTYPSTTTVSINTGIPTSGDISLSDFYGAEKP